MSCSLFSRLPCSWAERGTHTPLLEAHALDVGSGGSEVGTRAEGLSLPLVPWAAGQENQTVFLAQKRGGEAISVSLFLP